jgi:hypothetical protein
MRWIENGIVFGGSTAEFRALHPQTGDSCEKTAAEVAPEALVLPEFPKKTKISRRHLRVTADLDAGGRRFFKNAKDAFRWYLKSAPDQKLNNYNRFYYAIKKGSIRFAYATLHMEDCK